MHFLHCTQIIHVHIYTSYYVLQLTFFSNDIIKSGRSLSVAGRVNCDACMEEAKLERYICGDFSTKTAAQ